MNDTEMWAAFHRLTLTDLNWWGRLNVIIHNILLGPEFSYSPSEVKTIMRWGVKK